VQIWAVERLSLCWMFTSSQDGLRSCSRRAKYFFCATICSW